MCDKTSMNHKTHLKNQERTIISGCYLKVQQHLMNEAPKILVFPLTFTENKQHFVFMHQRRYYQQSKVENTIYRYKTIIGRKLRARTEEGREVETIIGCNILNRFLELGRSESVLVG